VVLIVGPEGGLIDFEVELLKGQGVQAVSLGERILRFENVIPYVIGKLF
jgi:RsmE family RNA methyltransferase